MTQLGIDFSSFQRNKFAKNADEPHLGFNAEEQEIQNRKEKAERKAVTERKRMEKPFEPRAKTMQMRIQVMDGLSKLQRKIKEFQGENKQVVPERALKLYKCNLCER